MNSSRLLDLYLPIASNARLDVFNELFEPVIGRKLEELTTDRASSLILAAYQDYDAPQQDTPTPHNRIGTILHNLENAAYDATDASKVASDMAFLCFCYYALRQFRDRLQAAFEEAKVAEQDRKMEVCDEAASKLLDLCGECNADKAKILKMDYIHVLLNGEVRDVSEWCTFHIALIGSFYQPVFDVPRYSPRPAKSARRTILALAATAECKKFLDKGACKKYAHDLWERPSIDCFKWQWVQLIPDHFKTIRFRFRMHTFGYIVHLLLFMFSLIYRTKYSMSTDELWPEFVLGCFQISLFSDFAYIYCKDLQAGFQLRRRLFKMVFAIVNVSWVITATAYLALFGQPSIESQRQPEIQKNAVASCTVVLIIMWFSFSILQRSLSGEKLSWTSGGLFLWHWVSYGSFEMTADTYDKHKIGEIDSCTDAYSNDGTVTMHLVNCRFQATMRSLLLFLYVFICAIMLMPVVTSFLSDAVEQVRRESHECIDRLRSVVTYEERVHSFPPLSGILHAIKIYFTLPWIFGPVNITAIVSPLIFLIGYGIPSWHWSMGVAWSADAVGIAGRIRMSHMQVMEDGQLGQRLPIQPQLYNVLPRIRNLLIHAWEVRVPDAMELEPLNRQ